MLFIGACIIQYGRARERQFEDEHFLSVLRITRSHLAGAGIVLILIPANMI